MQENACILTNLFTVHYIGSKLCLSQYRVATPDINSARNARLCPCLRVPFPDFNISRVD